MYESRRGVWRRVPRFLRPGVRLTNYALPVTAAVLVRTFRSLLLLKIAPSWKRLGHPVVLLRLPNNQRSLRREQKELWLELQSRTRSKYEPSSGAQLGYIFCVKLHGSVALRRRNQKGWMVCARLAS